MVLKISLAKEIAWIFNMKYFQSGVTDRRHFLCGDLVPWLEPFEKVLAIDGYQDTFVCVPLTIYSGWAIGCTVKGLNGIKNTPLTHQ